MFVFIREDASAQTAAYKKRFFLNNMTLSANTTREKRITNRYPNRQPNSGIEAKFMPYHPVIKVSGIKTAERMVNTFIM